MHFFVFFLVIFFVFFQAEDGIRDLVRSRGLGDVYKRQAHTLISLLGDTPGSISSCEYDTPGGIVVVNSTEGPPMTDTLVTLSLIHI